MGGVKYDSDKPRFDLIPAMPLTELACLYGEGAKKYTQRVVLNVSEVNEWLSKTDPLFVTTKIVLFTRKDFVGLVTKNPYEEIILNTQNGKGEIGGSGQSEILIKLPLSKKRGRMTQDAELETLRQNTSDILGGGVSIKPSCRSLELYKEVNAEFVVEVWSLLQQHTSTTTTLQGLREVCFVADATTASECFVKALGYCVRLYPTSKIRHHRISSLSANSVELVLDGARNWEKGMAWSRLFAATQRHLWAFWNGEDMDQETRVSHLTNAVFGCFALREYMRTHPELDDRPGKTVYPDQY